MGGLVHNKPGAPQQQAAAGGHVDRPAAAWCSRRPGRPPRAGSSRGSPEGARWASRRSPPTAHSRAMIWSGRRRAGTQRAGAGPGFAAGPRLLGPARRQGRGLGPPHRPATSKPGMGKAPAHSSTRRRMSAMAGLASIALRAGVGGGGAGGWAERSTGCAGQPAAVGALAVQRMQRPTQQPPVSIKPAPLACTEALTP